MKKYLIKKIAVSEINDLCDCNEPIKFIVNQSLVNKVFRAKKRFKNKYDFKSKKFFIFKGKFSKALLKKCKKEEINLLKMKPIKVQ